VENIQDFSKFTRIAGTLHKDKYAILISSSIFLRIKIFGTKVLEKINTYFMSNNIFFF